MNEQIYDIIAKHFTGESTAAEDRQLNSWLQQNGNRQHYLEMKKDWQASNFSDKFNPDKAWEKVNTQIIARQQLGNRRILQAAGAVAAVFIIALFVFLGKPQVLQKNMYISESETLQIELPDGSTVHLNKNSSLRIDKKFNADTRTVVLQGEAYFDIAVNRTKPFLIYVNEQVVEVTGTSFNIKANTPRQFELFVTSGSVQVSKSDEAQSIQLIKGEAVEQQTGRLVKNETYNLNRMSWHNKYFEFNFTPLPEAIQYINRAYGSNIHLAPESRSFVINSIFDNRELDVVVESICKAFGLQQKVTEDGLLLYGGDFKKN